MATKKFKTNLQTISTFFENTEDFLDYLIENNVFNDNFVKNITVTKQLNNIEDVDSILTINKNELHYKITYDDKKINVDITINDVFSYFDDEKELVKKMKKYILNEDYEKAQILKNYFNTIDLIY